MSDHVRSGCCALLVAISAACLPAADAPAPAADPAAAPVALVDGRVITLRELEDAVLRKEGVEQLEAWVSKRLSEIDWAKLRDDDPILWLGGQKLTRRELALQLLQHGVGKARSDLIQMAQVEAEMKARSITVGQEALDAAWLAMERQHDAQQTDPKNRIDFATYIRTKEGMEPEAFRREPGFRLFAGLRLIAIDEARASLTDDVLRRWFAEHHDRWDVPPAVQLACIHRAYERAQGPDGPLPVSPEERQRVLVNMIEIYRSIREGHQQFETTWLAFGKAYDTDAEEGGRIGWVTADGRRAGIGSRRLPPEAMQRAFAVTTFPSLIQPVAGPDGVDLLRVDARRPGTPAVYEQVRDRVIVDLIESTLPERMQATMDRLRHESIVEYRSLPDAIEARAK